MNGAPEVSVLMSTRDERPDFLDAALESLVAQTFRDFEVVLIDDGSTRPESIAVLERWAGRDDRIRLLREPPRGLTPSLNIGLGHCRGRFVARQDSDDWSAPERLRLQVAFLRDHPDFGLVGTQFQARMVNGRPLWRSRLPVTPEDIRARFPRSNPFCHGSAMFRRELALAVHGYRESFGCAQDYDFFWRLSEIANVANLDEDLYHYRYSGASVSARRAAEQASVAAQTRILARMRASTGAEDLDRAKAEAQHAIAKLDANALALRKQADSLLIGGQYADALRMFAKLLAASPFVLESHLVLLRGALFIALPPARPYLFGR